MVEIYDQGKVDEQQMTYVIIASRYNTSSWIFVRHRDRNTWELPAGHIEPGETAMEAAQRELFEESGAIDYKITALFDYSAWHNGKQGYGRVYFAEVETLGKLPEFEIAEITMQQTLPEELTYNKIQTSIFEEVKRIITIKD